MLHILIKSNHIRLLLLIVCYTRYSDKNRRFAHVDVVAYPDVAENLNIDISGTSKQLPTLVLFVGGR